MTLLIIQDSINVVQENLAQGSAVLHTKTNWWFWIAIVEFGMILLLIFLNRAKSRKTIKNKFKADSISQEVDFNNIINSSFNSIALYNALKVKCHPDRFPTDLEKNEIAENLFQEISKSKTNVKRLLELKKEAEQQLNINI